MTNLPGDALAWITDRLADLDIRYQVVGGLAAVAYGSRRSAQPDG